MKVSRAAGHKAAKRKSVNTKTSSRNLIDVLAAESQTIAILSLVVIAFVVYANSFGNDFVFDDIYLVQGNQQLRSLDFSLLLRSYRPLRDFSYAIDFAVWGEGPFGFHLTNLLLHTGNVLLVFALVRRLTEDLASAVLAGLIFAVHPIQTDAVTYISGRRDLLFSFFYLSAFHSYISYYRSQVRLRAALFFTMFVVFWAMSLLSKEMAASLPILIFVWHYCNAWQGATSWWRQILPTAGRTFARDKWFWISFALLGTAFAFYSVLFKGASARARNLEYWGGSFYSNALTVTRVHAWYLKQLVYPTPIAQYLGVFEPSQSALEWRFALSFLLVGGVLMYGFWLLNRDRLMAFAVFSYFVLLLPVSHIIPHHELLADHYLYLPMMSFALFVALLIRKLANRGKTVRTVVYSAAAIILVILATMTVIQNRVWKNERSLWTANLKAAPNSPRAALNLGNTYQDTEPAKAEALFKRALGLNPTPQIKRTLYDRLAVLLIQQEKFEEADFFAREILERSPDDFFGNLWSSQIHISKKECERARAALAKARSLASKPREIQLADQAEVQFQLACAK
jgi:tetratricopeptide (TPR) repeat protein